MTSETGSGRYLRNVPVVCEEESESKCSLQSNQGQSKNILRRSKRVIERPATYDIDEISLSTTLSNKDYYFKRSNCSSKVDDLEVLFLYNLNYVALGEAIDLSNLSSEDIFAHIFEFVSGADYQNMKKAYNRKMMLVNKSKGSYMSWFNEHDKIDYKKFGVEDITRLRNAMAQKTKEIEQEYHDDPLAVQRQLQLFFSATEMLVTLESESQKGFNDHDQMKTIFKGIMRLCDKDGALKILFPDLPYGHNLVQIFRENVDKNVDFEQSGEDVCEVVTPGSLLYPLLLPKIYPPLFTLYGLYNEKADEQYWRRIVSWNKQSDLALMSYLGIDQKFWTFEDQNIESPQRLSKIRDKSYTEAVETLQGLSTSFSPADKLYLIQSTFNMINKVVQDRLGLEYLWCMDDLFPVFQYVVVRARIQHLGAEIHFMDDVMEAHLEHGELGLMFTTLKASYYQIQNEKIA